MILVIDNYDSFTYNIVQALGAMHPDVVAVRNDKTSVEQAKRMAPDYLVVSPGPGRPEDAGVSDRMIEAFYREIPVLGVVNAERLLHGKASRVYHDSRTIYSGLPNPILGGRYHSLIVDEKSLPSCLEVSAYTREGEIMGIRHRDFPLEGVQFHPESVLTEVGRLVFQNFLNLSRVRP
jgi:para-aminobenzoate synthetase component 2